jgi:hypothetical protein
LEPFVPPRAANRETCLSYNNEKCEAQKIKLKKEGKKRMGVNKNASGKDMVEST